MLAEACEWSRAPSFVSIKTQKRELLDVCKVDVPHGRTRWDKANVRWQRCALLCQCFNHSENTGKTTLIKALKLMMNGRKKEYKKTLGSSKPLPQSPTDGIMQSREVILHPKDPNRRLVANFWDFGGQEIYVCNLHSSLWPSQLATHPFFLSERCVYVVCFNINSEIEATRHVSQFLHSWLSELALGWRPSNFMHPNHQSSLLVHTWIQSKRPRKIKLKLWEKKSPKSSVPSKCWQVDYWPLHFINSSKGSMALAYPAPWTSKPYWIKFLTLRSPKIGTTLPQEAVHYLTKVSTSTSCVPLTRFKSCFS